ncbi:HTH-type transcriptional regulator ImmR [Anaerotignum neopropionicum]|uniref:HTH-type transcriptional regulator ImmR n=1 Tax=Anaerotignum neopropionicum TaxID=36847 RepID=A0A136WEY1_9FIRM|nr:helix-turn-helix transcriptional regulator [Anaerotignum neopropionicum]KXL53061.1 HTH-type transcriptional regulator ImmR [Anaerotignum neopropionicum]
MEFHNRLKQLRKEKKMTQAALAKELAYGATAISNYESGHNQPSITDLKKIAFIFNVSMDYLVGVNEIRRPYEPDKKSDDFETFIKYYDMLEDRGKKELLFYMQWLLSRQESAYENPYDNPAGFQNSSLQVAQKPKDFKY